MTQPHFALSSIAYLIGSVLSFDRFRDVRRRSRLCAAGLMNPEEVQRIRQILAACDEHNRIAPAPRVSHFAVVIPAAAASLLLPYR
jgi:hypothetical protein